jgi:Rho family protein
MRPTLLIMFQQRLYLANNFNRQWFDEVNRLCPGTPIVLVGLKSDLRQDPEAMEDMRRKSLRFVESATVI